MNSPDIRWIQRFSNFSKAFSKLEKYVGYKENLNELEKQGLIQAFEYTFELAWNTIRDFYIDQGEDGIQGSKDAIRLAFKRGLVSDGDAWMNMIKDRNKSSHTYNQVTADEIVDNIKNQYFQAFQELKKFFDSAEK